MGKFFTFTFCFLVLVSCGQIETLTTNQTNQTEVAKTSVVLSSLPFDFYTGVNSTTGSGDGSLRATACVGAGDNPAGLYFCPNQTSTPIAFIDKGQVALSSVGVTNLSSFTAVYPSLQVGHVYSTFADGITFGAFKFKVNSINIAAGTVIIDYVYTTNSSAFMQ